MKKEILVLLVLVLMIGVALFYDQVLAVFSGMSPLEAMKQIVTFMLHVTVGTICAWVVFGLPKIVKPWLRMFQRRQRNMRRGRKVTQVKAPIFRPRKMSVEQMLAMLAPNQKISRTPTQRQPRDEPADLNF